MSDLSANSTMKPLKGYELALEVEITTTRHVFVEARDEEEARRLAKEEVESELGTECGTTFFEVTEMEITDVWDFEDEVHDEAPAMQGKIPDREEGRIDG